MNKKAITNQKRRQYLVWLVPVLSIALVVGIVWRSLPPAGENITLYMDDASGINEKQTRLQYRGVVVGEINEMTLMDDATTVKIEFSVAKNVMPLLREETQFWVVKPQLDTSGVKAINTLVSGPYLTFKPGEGELKKTFTVLNEEPLLKSEGVKFTLKSDLQHSINPGASIFYKDVPVGVIYEYELTSSHVIFHAQINSPYESLLRTNSVFWEQSGIEFDLSLFGASVSTSPIASLLQGGIGFATPEEPSELASENHQFELSDEMDKDWLLWKPEIKLPVHTVKEDKSKRQQEGLLPKGAE